MTSIRTVGRNPHHIEELERKKFREWIIDKLEERSYRWRELEIITNQEFNHNSPRYLNDALKLLQEKNMIIKQVISTKHTEYLLSKDFAKLQKSMQVHKNSLLAHQESLHEIKTIGESRESSDKVTSLIGMNITGKLLNLLLGIEVYSRTSPMFKEHAEDMIMSLVNQLGEYMVTSSKLSPTETDDAISLTTYRINYEFVELSRIASGLDLDPLKILSKNLLEKVVKGKKVIENLGLE